MTKVEYRRLKKGEVIIAGDETDGCADPWRDEPRWMPVSKESYGDTAPDPAYPSHRIYRRPIYHAGEGGRESIPTHKLREALDPVADWFDIDGELGEQPCLLEVARDAVNALIEDRNELIQIRSTLLELFNEPLPHWVVSKIRNSLNQEHAK